MEQIIRYINQQSVEKVFRTQTNPLNGRQMYWIDGEAAMYHGTKKHVEGVIKHLIEHNQIISNILHRS